jgi:hypothetical protein
MRWRSGESRVVRRDRGWQPLLWYLGIAVVVPLLDGARAGEHLFTTLAVATGFFLVVRQIAAAIRGRRRPTTARSGSR